MREIKHFESLYFDLYSCCNKDQHVCKNAEKKKRFDFQAIQYDNLITNTRKGFKIASPNDKPKQTIPVLSRSRAIEVLVAFFYPHLGINTRKDFF